MQDELYMSRLIDSYSNKKVHFEKIWTKIEVEKSDARAAWFSPTIAMGGWSFGSDIKNKKSFWEVTREYKKKTNDIGGSEKQCTLAGPCAEKTLTSVHF